MKQTLVILLLAGAFAGWLYYSSQRAGAVVCESCIAYDGATACGKAAAATRAEAMRQAATVACAKLTSGMDNTIRCGNTKPERARCDGEEAGAPAKAY